MDAGTLSSEHAQNYKGATITNIHRGKGNRSKVIYATIVDSKGFTIVSADLDYCVQRMKDVTQHF
jgi:hypothetical protein